MGSKWLAHWAGPYSQPCQNFRCRCKSQCGSSFIFYTAEGAERTVPSSLHCKSATATPLTKNCKSRLQSPTSITGALVSAIISSLARSSLLASSNPTYLFLRKPNRHLPKRFLFPPLPCSPLLSRRSSVCVYSSKDDSGAKFPGKELLRRWDVPWGWQTVSLISRLRVCFGGTIWLRQQLAVIYLGHPNEELGVNEKAGILFVDQAITTATVLGILYGVRNRFQPLPDDFFRCDLRDLFSLQKGWLLWAGIGLIGSIIAIALTEAAMYLYSGETRERETDALVLLPPLIGSSSISTACLIGVTGVLAPLLEVTVFRGFFMVSLIKWVPTPVSVLISAAVFALAHLTPGEFPQLFVQGTALGFSYAQTRNLLTPITMHATWNTGHQGYDIKELSQVSS